MLKTSLLSGTLVAVVACTGAGPHPVGRASAAALGPGAPSASSSGAAVAGALPAGLTPMPARLAATCRDAVAEEACANGDALSCWRLGEKLWGFCDPNDDGAGATLFERACELSKEDAAFRGLEFPEYVPCWVAADVMATRVVAPHDTRDFGGSARLLAARCAPADSGRDPRRALADGVDEQVFAICLSAAKAMRSSGDPGWVDLAQRACSYDETGCILAVEGLPLEQRYTALADRCEALLPMSFGGRGAEVDPKAGRTETIHFRSCYEAASLYEGNKGKLKARSWTTEKSVAALILRAEDAGLELDVDTLARIARPLWPHDPAAWKDAITTDPHQDAVRQLSTRRLKLCLRGEHALCDDDWLVGARSGWEFFDTQTVNRCGDPEPCVGGGCAEGLPFAPGMSCAYVASRMSDTDSRHDPQQALKFARRGCWLDDWTCGVYAHILEETGGPSGEIAFEYRRACDAGNAEACKATKR